MIYRNDLSMEKYLVFDRPVRIDLRPRNYSEIVAVPVLGFKIPEIEFSKDEIVDYIKYIVAVMKWEEEGNLVVISDWIQRNGNTYPMWDAKIREYIQHATDDMKLNATIWGTDNPIESGGFFYDFIFDPDIRDAIERDGHILDVVRGPFSEDKEGVS